MTTINEMLGEVTVDRPLTHLNLSVFPLLSDAANDPEYRVLDQALRDGCARVTEVDERGSVPELRFRNDCEHPVLLLDGEELVGAKQNRILNVSVLAPAGTELLIPVSCVEAGRWHRESASFAPSDRAYYASGRASKMRSVSESLRSTRSRRSNQAEVWADIAAKSERLAVRSGTEAAAAMYEAHQAHIDGFLAAFPVLEHQAGAIFAINGRLTGLDLFDNPQTWRLLCRKLLQSYALDAIDAEAANNPPPEPGAIVGFLDSIEEARVERFPGVGQGDDLRLSGATLTGGALEFDGRVIHLCAFAIEPGAGGPGRRWSGSAMTAASRRSSFYANGDRGQG